jgi:hypothetical protein
MDPAVLERIPSGVPFGFDDLMFLMFQMLEEEAPVNVFRHNGLWLDIGRVEDFLKPRMSLGMSSRPRSLHPLPREAIPRHPNALPYFA